MCEKMIKNEKDGVVYLTFPLFEKAGIKHGFSTKLGGVSVGDCATMNLSFTRGDDEKAVLENHRESSGAHTVEIRHPVVRGYQGVCSACKTVCAECCDDRCRESYAGRKDSEMPGNLR